MDNTLGESGLVDDDFGSFDDRFNTYKALYVSIFGNEPTEFEMERMFVIESAHRNGSGGRSFFKETFDDLEQIFRRKYAEAQAMKKRKESEAELESISQEDFDAFCRVAKGFLERTGQPTTEQYVTLLLRRFIKACPNEKFERSYMHKFFPHMEEPYDLRKAAETARPNALVRLISKIRKEFADWRASVTNWH